jgi:hypothetical protein
MLRKIVIFWCLLMLVPVSSFAEVQDSSLQNAIGAQVDQANRYLSAENSKALEKMKEDILTDMKAYNDENFRIFDTRMQNLMLDVKLRLIVGSLGVILLANGVVALVMIWVTRNYSYEAYLMKVAKQKQVRVDSPENAQQLQKDMKQINGMKQEAWEQQVPHQTLAMKLGEVEVANTSDMNRWQHQPAYQGAWTPPAQHAQQYGYQQYADQRGYTQDQRQYPPQQEYDYMNQGGANGQ